MAAVSIAAARHLRFRWSPIQEARSVNCDPTLTEALRAAVAVHQPRVLAIPSGAGHDAVALSKICPVAMLFVRCKRGLSHHPAESVRAADVRVALAVLRDFILLLARKHA